VSTVSLAIANFGAVWNTGEVDLDWRVTGTGLWTALSVERSLNGTDFTGIWQEPQAAMSLADYHYADRHPMPGRNFYRIKLVAGSMTAYSPVVDLINTNHGWKLETLHPGNGTQWFMELQTASSGQAMIRVVDAAGKSVLIKRIVVVAPGGSFTLDLSTLAAGEYFLQVDTEQGPIAARAIQRW
jgi:hypothetical protein